jgi:hypothetical protein
MLQSFLECVYVRVASEMVSHIRLLLVNCALSSSVLLVLLLYPVKQPATPWVAMVE